MRSDEPEVYRYDVGGLGRVVTFANVLITVVLIVGVYFDNRSATVAVLSGVAYFIFSTGLTVLTLSGALPAMVISRQQEVTIRRRDEQLYSLQAAQLPPPQRWAVADTVQIPGTTPAQLSQAPSFVPAIPRIADNIKVVAGSWVTQLFDTSNGKPLPNRITRNKGQVQMKSPEPDVIAYLESLGIIYQDNSKHLYWNVANFPTLRDALNSIRTGVKPPSSEGGRVDGLGRVNGSGGER